MQPSPPFSHRNLSFSQTDTLSPLNNDSFLPLPAPGSHHSTFCLSEFDDFKNWKEIKPVSPKENQPEYALEELMLKLKLQYFGYMMGRADSLEKTLALGKTEDKRRRGLQRMRWLDYINDSMEMNLSKLWEIVEEEPGML